MTSSLDPEVSTWLTSSRIYGNEKEVGQGIRDSGVPREGIFITSKLWNTDQPDVKNGLQKSLDALGTDYLDLYVRRQAPSSLPAFCH